MLKIGDREIGFDRPCFIVAEIGINHNGSIEKLLRQVEKAKVAGADAVKLQKRTPELCVPPDQRAVERDTPWGRMAYLDYRKRVELDAEAYELLDRYCRAFDLTWFASAWDMEALNFLIGFDVPVLKMPSPLLTDHALLKAAAQTGKPLVVSTGMSTPAQIVEAYKVASEAKAIVCHCTSAYPCMLKEVNLRFLPRLRELWPAAVYGYSGHEQGIGASVGAVAMGASYLERHFTDDKTQWGTDQQTSLEPEEFARMVRTIREYEAARGDGIKRVYESEQPAMQRLRRVTVA